MNFWVIHAQENPPEPKHVKSRRQWRSNTIAEYLSDNGHEVTRWRSSFSHQLKKQLVSDSKLCKFENYNIQYIYGSSYLKHVGYPRIKNHREIARNFYNLASNDFDVPDLIHVCNVPIELCYEAVKFAKQKNIPVVVDVRDLWPDIYLDLIPEKYFLTRRVVDFFIRNFQPKVKYIFKNATSITALTDSYLEWSLKKSGARIGKPDAVFRMCYPVFKAPEVQSTVQLRKKLSLSPNSIVVSYIGNIGYQSDFITIIKAAKILCVSQPNIRFVIAGSGPLLDDCRKLAEGISNIVLPGWLESYEIQALIKISTFGLIAFKSVNNFLMNIPNKFAEYLSGGLVVACGIGGEMGRLVQKNNCGFVYEEGNELDLSNRLSSIVDDLDTKESMSVSSRILHAAEFDSAKVFPKIAEHLVNIARSKRA